MKYIDKKLDEILGQLLGQASAEFMSNPKGKQIVMPAEKLYEYQAYTHQAIKQLIEVLTMQLQVEEFTKFYFEVKKDGDIDKYYDKRRIELANIYKGDK